MSTEFSGVNYKPREEKFPASGTEELGLDIWRAGGENVDIGDSGDELSGVFLHQTQNFEHL